MDDQQDRPVKAVSVPMSSGEGMSGSMGVAAPIGAVSRKDRERAARTALERDGSRLVVRTALRGTVALQRREPDGTWETVAERRTSRLRGRTRLDLPASAAGTSSTFRVVFAPANANITSWISEPVTAGS